MPPVREFLIAFLVILVNSPIIMSGMTALIIPMLFGLFSIYSDSVVRITFSLCSPGGAELDRF